jgi:hypothetical protein
VSVRRIASRPLFLAAATVLLALAVSFGVFPSTLPPHLQRSLRVSEGDVGSVYAGVAGLYALFTPLVVPLADYIDTKYRKNNNRAGAPPSARLFGLSAVAVAGTCLCALGHMLFGPSPLLRIPEEALRGWRRWALEAGGGGAAYGVGSAFAFVPLLPLMQASVADLGVESAEMTAGLFNGGYYFGELLGGAGQDESS